jgi:DNA sulfur modification protein DndD
MLFTKLKLVNFGLFRGYHELDLQPRIKYGKTRPIILFGGKNGSGKTTILEAVRLCLYGPLSLGLRTKRSDYETFLKDKIHRSSKEVFDKKSASVGLEFSYAQAGEKILYYVQRTWNVNGKSVTEDFRLEKNGELVTDLAAQDWQDFVKELIPPALSQFFFFDGEQIMGFAENDVENVQLAESIHSLLGLDLLTRLQSDLRIYLNRELRKKKLNKVNREIGKLEKEKEDTEKRILELRQDRAQLESKIQSTEARLQRLEDNLKSEGGSYAKRRDTVLSEKVRLESKIESIDEQLRELCAGLLPFSLCPELSLRLKETLIKEQDYQVWEISHEFSKKMGDELEKSMSDKSFWDSIDANLKSDVKKRIASNIHSKLSSFAETPEKYKDFIPIHRISRTDSERLIQWIDEVTSEIPGKLKKILQERDKTYKALQTAETDLQRAPSDDTIEPLVNEMKSLHETLGDLRKEAEIKENEIKALERKLADTEKAIDQHYLNLKNESKLSDKLNLINKVQTTLEDYYDKLTKSRMDIFRNKLTECFNTLSRKDDLVRDIKIDPKTYSVTLMNGDKGALNKNELSAGEKQIYAISLLWALAQASGRPLPVIVDTPLGRLDSDHRKNLIDNYFPAVSHQVLILSTDTEIDKRYFDELRQNISHAFNLEYMNGDGATCVREGYFWKG